MQLLPRQQNYCMSVVRLPLVCEVGSTNVQALRTCMQADQTRDRSFFCKCVSRLDARQVPWYRQGPEELIMQSRVLMFLWSSTRTHQSHTSLIWISYEFLFHKCDGCICGEPCGRSSMAPSCTCLFICLCRSEIQPRIWMCSGRMSSACTRNSEFLTGSVPSRWQCSPQKVEFQISSISDSESAWVLWVPLSISVLQCLMLVLINSRLWW